MPDETADTPEGPQAESPARRVFRVPPGLWEAAAARLVGPQAGDPAEAGRRFVRAAPSHGIDLELMWATPGVDGRERIGQVCLAVPGAGRTAVFFLSGPRGSWGAVAAQHADRVAVVSAACTWLAANRPSECHVAQALPEPDEDWATGAYAGAGFLKVGDLAYLRRPAPRRVGGGTPAWPPGVEVRSVRSLEEGDPDREALVRAMDSSYIDTLDCPALCGLRATGDVLESHRATGEFDPSLWYLVTEGGEPAGCLLFNRCPEQQSIELVYLGLAPSLRGRGLAARLLEFGLARVGGPGYVSVTCAVDRLNAPAITLYRRAGFREFSGRIAMVRRLA